MFLARLPLIRSAARVAFPLVCLLGVAANVHAQPAPANKANWTLADKFSNQQLNPVVYSTSLTPRWIAERDSLWYNWQDKDGSRFELVVPKTKTKQPLFDHVKLATQLSTLHHRPYDPKNLPFTNIDFDSLGKTFRFNVDTGSLARRYEWTMATETLVSLGAPPRDSAGGGRGGRGGGRGGGGRGGGRGGGGGNQDFRNFSPDSTAFAFARDHNLFVVDVATSDTIQLTRDGEANYSFGFRDTSTTQQQNDDDDDDDDQQIGGGRGRGGRGAQSRDPRVRANVTWSPDSRAFYVQRTDSRKVKELYLVDVLAEPRPTLRSYRYAMPGEENVNQQEIFSYRRGERTLDKLPIGKWKDQRIMGPHWTTGSEKLRLVRRDRLQRNLELIEVDLASRDIKVLITEAVENANLEPATANVRYTLTDTAKDTRSGDMIWWSERTGWGHFYLYDFNGNLKRPITSGPWRAESIVELDSAKRVAYIRGVGREPGENPYYTHLYRVNLDNGQIALLDPGDAHHTNNQGALSPSKRYLVDVASRVDLEPSAVLRDATTGAKIMDLETMDLTRLEELGWQAPSTFVVKAADGVTDIYGNMWLPFDFDSTKKYPIIAHVYPGPQTESVTPGFSATATNQRLAQLGFVVIQIGNRGGSPQRSNAYQSYSYFNLRDYGLADKKAGIEQLAARHRWIDIDKVGIYGHSGGGFMTAAALLLPPYNEFFKVGVSSSGNHDNNVYNQNWSEQYHGLTMEIERSGSNVVAEEERAGGRGGQGGRGGGRGGRGGGQGGGRGAGGGVGALGARGGGQSGQVAQGPGDGAAGRDTTMRGDTTVRVDTVFKIHVPANHELAANLKGRLLLVHGDMDNNVHPAGTIRLVNALIRANKRFDLMIMPGQPHSYGPMQGYFTQMMYEYFAEHLLGDYYRGSAEIR